MKKYILFLLPLFLGLLVSNDIEAKKKKYSNGDRYEGEWKDGAPNGNGKMIYANGDIYIGSWLSGNKHGEGEMTYANGDHYGGSWRTGAKDGDGKMIYANGNIYEGNWKMGVRNGYGTMSYANGNCYKGNWKDGNYDGNSIMKYANGDVYEGEWKLENPSGRGRMAYANGNIYEGSWRMGVRDGNGTITYTNGDSFECNYSNGILVSGTLSRNNGDQYTAKWFDYKSGKGTIKYKNGDVYVGSFKDLLPDGEGKLTDEDGLGKNGKWEMGILKDGKEERKGIYGIYTWNVKEGKANDANIITLESGGTYKGEIKNDLPSGHGVFSNYNCSLDGFWENGKLTQIKEGSIKECQINSASHPVTLDNGNLQILINYSDFTTEIKQYPNCEINQLSALIRDVIYYIIDKNEPKKRKQEEQERMQEQQERLRKEEQEKEKEKRLEEEKLKPLIQKYGIKYAKSIKEGKIKIGMTVAMLNEMDYFWEKTKQTTANGVIEIWKGEKKGAAFIGLLSGGYYKAKEFFVTLVNGKVVKIVEE